MSFARLAAAVFLLWPVSAVAQLAPPQSDAGPDVPAAGAPLETVLQLGSVANGFASTSAGRMFLPLSHIDGSAGPQLVEWVGGKPVPFPDAAWNSWAFGDDPASKFVHVNAVRVGPQGSLWVVDVGAPGIGHPMLPHGAKIVKIDLATGKVARIYALDAATEPKSFINDIRFHGNTAYITDAGAPAIILLDLTTGAARRVLDGDPSMTAQRPLTGDDHVLRGPDGKPVKIHADQLEVSPDGKFLFYQPASGPMSRVATRYLDDPKLTSPQLAKHITTFSKTRSTGGTAIDANGTIYSSDTDKHAILTINADGHQAVLVQDPRLLWVDAMWIDDAGYLYLPAAQLDRMAPFNDGVSKLELPVSVYRIKIGVKPPPTDHP